MQMAPGAPSPSGLSLLRKIIEGNELAIDMQVDQLAQLDSCVSCIFKPPLETHSPLYSVTTFNRISTHPLYASSYNSSAVSLLKMPFTAGLQVAASLFATAGFSIQFTVAVILLLLIVTVVNSYYEGAPDEPKSLQGFTLLTIYPFFKERFTFLNWAISATDSTVFQFKLLRVSIIRQYFMCRTSPSSL